MSTVIQPSLSRLSFRAVLAGTLVICASFLSLLALIASFAGWKLDLQDLPATSATFWIPVFTAWILSVYFGAWVASRAGTLSDRRSMALTGVVTWASACVFVTAILMMITNESFNFVRSEYSDEGPFWIVFLGNAIALAAALHASREPKRRFVVTATATAMIDEDDGPETPSVAPRPSFQARQ